MKARYARDVMNAEVLTVQANWPVSHLAEFLIDTGISGAPVTDEFGALIGVVSLTDVVRHESLPQREPHLHTPHEYYLAPLSEHLAEEEYSDFRIDETEGQPTVRDIMTPTIFRVSEHTPIQEVAETLITGRIHRVFVTRGKMVVGIITALDLLRVIRDLDHSMT